MGYDSDPYEVEQVLPPAPERKPDPRADYAAKVRAEFGEAASNGPVPLYPPDAERQRAVVPDDNVDDIPGADRNAGICLMRPGGGHRFIAKNCPHDLPTAEEWDEVTKIEY